MAVKVKSTESSRRHAFKSFRERVDSIKIEPSRRLEKRVHDEVESSHLLTTLEHWKELNLSKVFTELVDSIEELCQSLPQVLHYQLRIFEAIYNAIKQNDVHSLQPSLELLTQFIHDLGPDFLAYYIKTLHLLSEVALAQNPNDFQNNRNSSNALDWIFNALAFAFKYLVRYLVEDLKPTFQELAPLLKLKKQTYISRFCAESLSYLIRKLGSKSLNEIVEFSLESQVQDVIDNDNYCESLKIMYSESMKNTTGTFHTKAKAILSSILNCIVFKNDQRLSLQQEQLQQLQQQQLQQQKEAVQPKLTSLLSDILLDVLHHGEQEACAKFYEMVTLSLQELLEKNPECTLSLLVSCQILSTLSFADSGRKVSDWSCVLTTVDKIITKLNLIQLLPRELTESFVYLLVITFRNADSQALIKYQKRFFQVMITINEGNDFLLFAESALAVAGSKVEKFAIGKHIRDFINRAVDSADKMKRVILFLNHAGKQNLIKQTFTIPSKSVEKLSIAATADIDSKSYYDLYWKLLIFNYAKTCQINVNLLTQTLFELPDDVLGRELASMILSILYRKISEQTEIEKKGETLSSNENVCRILAYLDQDFVRLNQSSSFLKTMNDFVKFATDPQVFLQRALDCLYLPSHETRENAIELIFTIMSLKDEAYLQTETAVLSQIRIIEQIPLTIDTSRDILLRVRNLASEFAKDIKPSSEDKKIIVNYLFGLLSNRFQPCWKAVYEALPLIANVCRQEIWQIAYFLLTKDYNNQIRNDIGQEEFMDVESTLVEWQPRNTRLYNNFAHFENLHMKTFRNVDGSIVEICQNSVNENTFNSFLKSNVLSALKAVPQVIDASRLVLLVVHGKTDDEQEQDWLRSDRNELLAVLAQTKNLKKLDAADELFQYMKTLLASTFSKTQQLALNVIFAYNNPVISKYRDKLKNLLDDVTFSDEIITFTTSNSTIEDIDRPIIMPLVVRILFGKVQGKPKSNSKQGNKNAVVSFLPNFNNEDIISFISVGADKLDYANYFNKKIPTISLGYDKSELRRMAGFINLVQQMYEVLSKNYADVLAWTIKPLVYSLISAQNRLDVSSSNSNGEVYADAGENENDNEDEQISNANIDHEDREDDKIVTDKIAKSIRLSGMRCLKDLFVILGPEYDWSVYVDLISEYLIAPRLPNFSTENLQQPLATLTLMSSWINQPNTIPFLYANDFAAVNALLSILGNDHAKESVSKEVLGFAVKALEKKSETNDEFFTLLAIIVDSLLQTLPSTIKRIYNPDVGSLAIRTLLLMIQGEYIDNKETQLTLIQALTFALEKSNLHIDLKDKANVLIALSSLLMNYDCEFGEVEQLYQVCSKLLRVFAAREIRETLATLFETFGLKFQGHLLQVGNLIVGLNAYTSRMNEYDFQKRLGAFKLINEDLYLTFDAVQWSPLINCALFFINDQEELSMRSNAGYMIKRFVDCLISQPSAEDAVPFVHMLKDTVLPILRLGIRKTNEDVQNEYILVLEYIVRQSTDYFTDMRDMQILLGEDNQDYEKDEKDKNVEKMKVGQEVEEDEALEDELRFFQNITSIQLHLRYRAIKYLMKVSNQLKENSISHYILPIIEAYVLTKEEKYRNIGLIALESISVLARSVTWSQYKAIFKRYLSNLKSSQEQLKPKVNLVVAVSSVLKESVANRNEGIKNLPSQDEIDLFILNEISPALVKIIQVRDDDTIVARAPLAEAAINLTLCLSPDKIEGELPKILTSMCQVLRSRSEELREAIRKSLGKIAIALGARYLPFIIKELKTALSRGSQIHVLSYTVHYLLQSMAQVGLQHGDLNESISLIMDVVMEDIFGAAGQEKDADGYTSKMKEVKFKKSFDSCEIVSSNISLSHFGELIEPIKLLLQEVVNHKVQVKLDELLRRLSLGLNHNIEASKLEILHLCYEIFLMSSEPERRNVEPTMSASEAHFMTTLNRKKIKNHVDKSLYRQTMQRLSFELLRTAISRHDNLLNTANLKGFVPLLEEGMNANNENVILISLRVLTIIIRLPFDDETQGLLKTCARRALVLIKDSPTTNSDVCQAALKFLATTLKHNKKVELKESAISYVLTKIQPDLEEPNRQGLAFQFLKAVVSQHLLLPELYDLMDNVAKLMVVNHSKEIRDMSRAVFFQFLMEYDQSKGRLEKQFKFLVNNLTYPTEEGRQSVMELIHLIIAKAGPDLISKLGSSFFITLANVLVSDDSAKSREMANVLLSSLVKKLPNIGFVEEYCSVWLKQSSNMLLKRCGLNVYKMLISVFGVDKNKELDKVAVGNIQTILNSAKNSEEGGSAEWELVYSALSAFSSMASSAKDSIFDHKYKTIWSSIVDCLLFPHSWIRLITCRLVAIELSNLNKSKLDTIELELIAGRLTHQLRTPSISEDLANQCIKNLVMIAMHWETSNTMLQQSRETEEKEVLANDYLVGRICSIVKQENVQSIVAKKAAIKFLALFIQLTKEDKVEKVAETIISSLYNFTDPVYSSSLDSEELLNISLETLNMVKAKIGVTEYTQIYAQVQKAVNIRRLSRKAKRSQMAVTAPDVANRRKTKKHERSREKRRHERDENGYYKPKKRRAM